MRSKLYAALALSLLISLNLSAFKKRTTPTPPKQSQAIKVLREASEGFSEVADSAIPAVVSIKACFEPGNSYDPNFNDFFYHFFGSTPQQSESSVGFGSGFFVTDDGYILTNNHLVKDAANIKVSLYDGREFDAEIVGTDPSTEVALIKVKGKNFPYLTLADSDKVKIGQWAIAIGNPFEFKASVTVGVVSATGRNRLGGLSWENYIQTDAAINPGNSGGPLLDINGEVIGINTAILTKTGGYMGLSFAVPSNIAEHVAEQLFEHGYLQRGYLGVRAQSLTPDLAEALGLDSHNGIVVVDVAPDSPAQKAGLEQQDVITEFNGKLINNQMNLTHEVSLLTPGTKVTLTINRNGKVKQLNAVVGAHPMVQNTKETPPSISSQNSLGMTVENLTPAYAHQLGYDQLSGVLITQVKQNSQMAYASVRAGTLILSVNRQKVSSVAQFQQAITQASKNKHVLLLVRYGKITRYITVSFK